MKLGSKYDLLDTPLQIETFKDLPYEWHMKST